MKGTSLLNNKSRIFQILNFSPWPGGLNLLEFFILIVGISFAGFLFLFTSNLNNFSESMYIFSLNSLRINLSVRHVYNSLNEKLAGNNEIDLEKDILLQFESAQIACSEMENNRIIRDYLHIQNQLGNFPQSDLLCKELSSLKNITITSWMDYIQGKSNNSRFDIDEAFGKFFDIAQPLADNANPQIENIRYQIHSTNLILGLGMGIIFIAVTLILRRNRKVRQDHLRMLEEEADQRTHLDIALYNEQNKFSSIITNWPDPILMIDAGAKTMVANQAAALILGVSDPNLLVGKPITGFLPPDLANEILEINQLVLTSGTPIYDLEKSFFNKTTGKQQQLIISKVPLRDQNDQIIGLFWVTHDITSLKQTEEALKVANTRLMEGIAELERRAREMDLLTQMIDLLSACPTKEEAFDVIENQLEKLDLADSGILYMINPSRNNIEQVAVWGQTLPDSPIFSPGDCWGLRRGRLHAVEMNRSDIQKDHLDNPLICPHIAPTTPADYLCLPLVAQGETLGLLHLRRFIDVDSDNQTGAQENWFTPQKIQHISVVAESLALALANLSLRTTLRQQSIRDPLTGLFNRRYLEETLERELLRASRSKKNVGLIMIDVDCFKQYNDIYGHPAADSVLSKMGHVLLRSIRREDVACRYGGDEFLLMLPEADLNTTLQRAEEIREKVSQLSVQFHGQELQHISISIGVGIFPDHGQTPEMLIQNVDRALYQSKNNGRNKVSVDHSTE